MLAERLAQALSPMGSLGSAYAWESYEHPANIPLHPPAHPAAAAPQTSEQQQHAQHSPSAMMLGECRHICHIAGPLFVEGVAAIGQQLVASSCVGHLNNDAALSALILAQSLYNVSGYSLVSGLASALETLCGQAYGARNFAMMSVTLVRAQLVCAVAVLPTLLLWGSGRLAQLLPALGQQADIAEPASRLLWYMSPALALSVLSETVAQYLLAQSKALPIMVSSLVGLGLSPLLYWGMVFGLGLGLKGAAWAAVSIQSSLVLLLLGYLAVSECLRRSKRTAKGWEGIQVMDVLQPASWWSYLQYGLPCVLMVCLEWWMWEVVVLLAGLLPDAEVAVAVTGLSTQIQTIPWIMCYSLGTATSTRVAQALGAGDAARAARLFRASCVLVLVASAAMCAGMWFGKSYLAAALTSSAAVQQQLKRVVPLVVATVMLDGQAAVLSGVLRGAGRQGIGAGTSWCSYWLIGLPLAYLLAFKAGMGVLGLRLSLAAAVAAQALVLHVFTACRIDWDEEVRRARDLVAVAGGDEDEDVPAEACDQGLLESGSGLLVVPTQHAQDSSSAALQRPLLANEGLV